MITFNGDRISIGGKSNIVRKITKHTFHLEKDDSIFLFTDGYVDQCGGPNCDKFKYKRFRELLMRIHHQEIDTQRSELEETINEWKGDRDQVDDITIMGFKIES